MQLAIGLLIFSWIMLLAVVGFTFRTPVTGAP